MMKDIKITLERVGSQLPTYGSAGAAGADLYACVAGSHPILIAPGNRTLIPTGIKVHLPETYEAQIRPRSGLALKHGVTVLNAPGTIDSDYTGEIGVVLINNSDQDFFVTHGDRIAQMVIKQVEQFNFVATEEVAATTERGDSGYGSTGK